MIGRNCPISTKYVVWFDDDVTDFHRNKNRAHGGNIGKEEDEKKSPWRRPPDDQAALLSAKLVARPRLIRRRENSPMKLVDKYGLGHAASLLGTVSHLAIPGMAGDRSK